MFWRRKREQEHARGYKEGYRAGQAVSKPTHNPIVIAPNMQQATTVCKWFNLNPRYHARSTTPELLRGYGPGTVFFLYNLHALPTERHRELMQCIRVSGGTIITVPEFAGVVRR